MASKFDTPEFKKSPIRAQIDEALREVEQVKVVLLALQRKLPQLEEFHSLRREFTTQSRNNRSPTGDPGRWAKGANTYGEFSRDATAGELSRLDGWMKSLIESEIGLNAMLSPGDAGAIAFAAKRSHFINDFALIWVNRMFLLMNR